MDGKIPEPDDFKIKGTAAKVTLQPTSSEAGACDACTICLEPVSERAVAVPCNHLTFDFLCLISWLQEQPRCPLCKAQVTAVQYDWRSPEDYKTYRVPVAEDSHSNNAGPRPSRFTNVLARRRRPVPARRPSSQTRTAAGQHGSLEQRREVYRHRLFSLRVGANRISQYRDFTAHDFAHSPDLQSRARTFLRRELQVFTFLDRAPRGGSRDFLIEYIVAELKLHDLRGADGTAEQTLRDFLGRENARQLLHELDAWLRSPFMNLRDWDVHVQYPRRGSSSFVHASVQT